MATRATSRTFGATSRAVEGGDASALLVSGKGGSGRAQREALLPVAKGITARRGRRALRHVEDAVPYNRRGGVTAADRKGGGKKGLKGFSEEKLSCVVRTLLRDISYAAPRDFPLLPSRLPARWKGKRFCSFRLGGLCRKPSGKLCRCLKSFLSVCNGTVLFQSLLRWEKVAAEG